MATTMKRIFLMVLASATLVSGCASLQALRGLIQAPRFEEAPGHRAEIRLLSPSTTNRLGGAGVRLWAQISNPNPFGFTLSTLRGTLFLDESRATTVDFPLGMPLQAGGETVVPIDLQFGFSELPQLGNALKRALGKNPIDYRLEGTIGVEAGRFGTPTFGPMTLLRGTIQ
jgi:hypothetical protein